MTAIKKEIPFYLEKNNKFKIFVDFKTMNYG